MARMRNEQVMEAFLWGNKQGESHTGNLYIMGDKLINYNTVIAHRIFGRIILNTTKYSPTTSKLQNYLHRQMPNVDTVVGVPIGAWSLEAHHAEQYPEQYQDLA